MHSMQSNVTACRAWTQLERCSIPHLLLRALIWVPCNLLLPPLLLPLVLELRQPQIHFGKA